MIIPDNYSPYYALPFNNQTSLYWIAPGETSIFITDMSGAFIDITRANGNYSATLDRNWTGGVLGGEFVILNNGIDAPQSWSGSASELCQDLKYDAGNTWGDVSYTCGTMRVFKEYLFALDVTKSGTRYPTLVKWSSSSVAGAVPATWDESDATNDAGETALSDDIGFLVDALPLGDTFVIYGEGAATGCQYIGGRFVFRFFRLFDDGLLSRRCVKPVYNKHVVFSLNDVILHDGHTPTSILDNRRRKWLFNQIDQSNYERSFVTANYKESEIWFCFPQTGSTVVDMSLVWNYRDNTFTEKELPDLNHIAYGIVDPGTANNIDAFTNPIDTYTQPFDARAYNPTIFYPLGCGDAFYQLDETEQQAGVNMTAYVERLGLDFGVDADKFVRRLIPKMTASGPVTVSLALQTYPDGPTTYKHYTFNPNTDWKIDTRATAKLIGYRVSSNSNITWDLSSIDFDYEIAGAR